MGNFDGTVRKIITDINAERDKRKSEAESFGPRFNELAGDLLPSALKTARRVAANIAKLPELLLKTDCLIEAAADVHPV